VQCPSPDSRLACARHPLPACAGRGGHSRHRQHHVGEGLAAHFEVRVLVEGSAGGREQDHQLLGRRGFGVPRGGFTVTNLSCLAEHVVAFHDKRGTCEQWIKKGKGAIEWTRLSCRTFAANAVRLQLHALAYNLGNFLRTPATPELIKNWSLTSLKDKLIKVGAKVVRRGRHVFFQMAEAIIPGKWRLSAELRPQPPPSPA
jgi:hypothetical protein